MLLLSCQVFFCEGIMVVTTVMFMIEGSNENIPTWLTIGSLRVQNIKRLTWYKWKVDDGATSMNYFFLIWPNYGNHRNVAMDLKGLQAITETWQVYRHESVRSWRKARVMASGAKLSVDMDLLRGFVAMSNKSMHLVQFLGHGPCDLWFEIVVYRKSVLFFMVCCRLREISSLLCNVYVRIQLVSFQKCS